MKGRILLYGSLTHAERWQAYFLTFSALFFLLIRVAHADILPPFEAVQKELDKQRISQATSYLRTQALKGTSLLPDEVRDTIGWFKGNWHPIHIDADDDEDVNASSLSGLPAAPKSDDDAVDLIVNYHHKGFLPMHDAILVGAAFKQNIVAHKLDLTARPFVGQSWNSLRNYWGAEMTLDVAQKADGLPWGKISLGYVGGNDKLTDHGTGIDLHGDIDLTSGWKFTSGIRQDSADGNSNYMMVKWKMEFQ